MAEGKLLDTAALRQRAKKRGKSRDPTGDAERAIDGLEKLQEWLKKRHIRVYLTKAHAATYYDERKEIELNANLSLKKKLVFLLHECGHVLIGKRLKDERWGMSEIREGERCTFRHIVDVVDEEFEAWARAKKLADRLGIQVDEDSWSKTKTWALVTYIRWANKDRKYNDGDYSGMRTDEPEPDEDDD